MQRKLFGVIFLILLFPFFLGCEPKTTTSGITVPTTEEQQPDAPEPLSDEEAEELLKQFDAKISPKSGPMKVLKLDKCDADDSLLPWIGKQTSLVELSLVQTKISDDGVMNLTPLKNLKKLRLSSTAITDRSAAALAELTALEDLDVSNTALGNDAAKELAKLTNLKKLNLYTTKIDDTGVESLAPLQNLTWLNLDNCPITDAAIAKLEPLQKLVWLHLGRTALSDVGLQKLAELKIPLKEVHITRTQITPEGAKQFKAAFPDCIVHDTVKE